MSKEAVVTVVAAASKHIPDGPPPPELFSLMHPPATESAMQLYVMAAYDALVCVGLVLVLTIVLMGVQRHHQTHRPVHRGER